MLLVSYQKSLIEAGCDEAGRGCYAGDVFAASVVLNNDCKLHPLINDSKKLSEKQRNSLLPWIEENALCYAVAQVSVEEIDRINILNAAIKAMHISLDKLLIKPEFIVVDGNRFIPYQFVPSTTIVKGDAKYANIAAASILAKTSRDQYMTKLHDEFPVYDWINNKGYGTLSHRKAIEQYGLCKYHRKSYDI